MKVLRPFLLGLVLALGALPNFAVADSVNSNCYGDLCVGDRAIDLAHSNREVSVLAVDYRGWFITRAYDNGEIFSDVFRPTLAATVGCTDEFCVGFPVMMMSPTFDFASIAGLQLDGRFVLRSTMTNQLAANLDREAFAATWGCVNQFCVNDTVYQLTAGKIGTVIAASNRRGSMSGLVVQYSGASALAYAVPFELSLLQHGPTAHPPQVDCPRGMHWDSRTDRCVLNIPNPPPPPTCPWGTHWDPWQNRCVPDAPPPPPSCPWGTHWDNRQQRCVRDTPPPPPSCPSGTHWDPNQNRCVSNHPTPPPPPTCPSGTHWDPRTNRCVSNRPTPVPPPHPNPHPDPVPPQTCPPGRHWDPRQNRCV